jgi:23S rRNA (cytosine1962-C5)-methyltransferase
MATRCARSSAPPVWTAGKPALADALLAATGCTKLYERSDASVRELEGLTVQTGWLRGEGPTDLTITEHGWQLTLDVALGHKTGFYLDQRDNRAAFAQWVRAAGLPARAELLQLHRRLQRGRAGRRGQQVTSVDSSAPALQRVAAHVAAQRLRRRPPAKRGCRRQRLPAPGPAGRPALRRHRAGPAQVRAHRRACRARGPRLQGHQPPGADAAGAGRAAASPSAAAGGIGADLFHKIVAGAGMDAGVDGAILQRLEGAPDHPTTLEFPEGEYLKGLAPKSAPQGALLLATSDPQAGMDLHESRMSAGQGGLEIQGTPAADLVARIKANTELLQSLGADSVPHLIYRAGAEGPYGVVPGGLPTAELAKVLGL